MIGNFLNPLLLAHRLMPRLTTEVLSLVNMLLPQMGGIGRAAARGFESESFVSPSVLTSLGDAAAAHNNEMRTHPVEERERGDVSLTT